VHTRLPVIFQKETEHSWLDDNVGLEKLLPLLNPYPAQLRQMYNIIYTGKSNVRGSPRIYTVALLGKDKNRLLVTKNNVAQ
jgi:putative SOS response-associated peptidase YedK